MIHAGILVYQKNSHNSGRLCEILRNAGFRSVAAFYPAEAEIVAEREKPDLLIASFDLFPLPPALAKMPLIISAPMGEFQAVGELARKQGAFCLTWPYENNLVLERVRDVLAGRRAKASLKKGAADLMPEIAGKSESVRQLRDLIITAAKVDSSILLTGETGTGKELTARALHRLGARAGKPFVALNCGALAEGVLESELFGHERGSFTGAVKRYAGKFESAHGGSLFLDEIGDMPQSIQVKLLRVLESGKFFPVGGNAEKTVDARIICATNRNIFRMAEEGAFRRDLLYRINVIAVRLPPLRERKEDIKLLADIFLKEFAAKYSRKIDGFSSSALKTVMEQTWPGNVRELRHAVERAVVHCKGETIEEIRPGGLSSTLATGASAEQPDLDSLVKLDFSDMKKEVLGFYEKEYIDALLSLEGGIVRKVARRCGMDRKTLYRKMKDYGLDKKDYR